MAFCNSCGNNLESGARFCSKCGTTQPATSSTSIPVGTPPQAKNNNTVKVVLIVVAAVVVMGVFGLIAVTAIGIHIARRSHIENRDGNVRIESPFGNVETSNDPEQVASSLGVELYPGAHLLSGNSANVTVAGMHTVAGEFETDDPPDKVAQFYQSKFPNPNVSTSDAGNTTIVSTDKHSVITITIQPDGSKTRIHIASVSGKGVGSETGA
jgi:hypothetical protein